MPFFAYIGRPSITIDHLDAAAIHRRERSNSLRRRHPDFPLANEPGSKIRQPPKPPPIRHSVPTYSKTAAVALEVLRLDPQGFARIYARTGSVKYAAAALLGN